MSTDNLCELINFRLSSKVRAKVLETVAKKPNQYENESHFYRVAIMKELRCAR